ncbi:hypothetical protein EUX98_g3541 [Antrodiella citrinella]|uniref:Uncharacterized protein n=1 Tax=Antrodiella citrinella TaxID=2447956 RepID=A0A4S4MWB2_9APHY|nr:hypothetical protein EUX98_g3541 [Antrodiella citrinella]
MSLTATPNPPSTSTAAVTPGSHVDRDDAHKHRRRFIGPLPETVVSHVVDPASNKGWFHRSSSSIHSQDDDDDEDATVKNAIKTHALQFFLRHGGREEDWGDAAELHVSEEMLRKWRDSEWGKLRGNKDNASIAKKRWIGTSFDVGVFLGVDILSHAPKPAEDEADIVDAFPSSSVNPVSTAGATFVTARSRSYVSSRPTLAQQHHKSLPSPVPHHEPSSDNGLPQPSSADSSTALLPPRITVEDPDGRVHSEVISRSFSDFNPLRATGTSDSNLIMSAAASRGKGRAVHYVDSAPIVSEEPPAPVGEVLARTGSEIEDSSAGAVEQSNRDDKTKWGDVIMRDRMLVRVSYTNAASVGVDFDEAQDRVDPHIQSDNWLEYIVAWRKDRLELYRDHATPGKEWFTGHKHLTFMIPLEPTTRLSVYSFTDLTFCVTCPPTPIRTRSKGRALLYGTKKGTNIFIFKHKSRTRAADWVWHLWRHMGGTLPASIEIKLPALNTRMNIDIPTGIEEDINGAYTIFSRSNVLALCRRALRKTQERDIYVQRALEGAKLELAWRIDTVLDWVWQTDDVEGHAREWAVLCGLALKQGHKPAHLELRLKQHVPTRLHLKDGTRLDEPLSIEGFAERVRPSTQLKHSVYLATHDGYLFSLTPANAHPPLPPGLPSEAKDAASLHASEVQRGEMQVLHATGVSDLRNILTVRRAFQQVPVHTEHIGADAARDSHWEDSAEFWDHVERTDEDEMDQGGEEGLAVIGDKIRLRVRRSFELLLVSGRVIRFETHSCKDALEWITRLRQLVSYWRKHHQFEAKQEMDLSHHVAGRPRLTPHKRRDLPDAPPDQPPDPEAALPELSSFYNWCVLDSCRAILKSGRLFGRKGLRGMYKHVFFVLVSGHIVQYRISRTSALQRRYKTIHLLDAYACSGYLAAQHLPDGQFDPDSPPLARRYQDGLESDECEDDTLFVLWYRGNTAALDQTLAAAQANDTTSPGKMDVPALSAKRKLNVYRTRSKLERDAWVWAINAEIDKTVRLAKEREEKVREAGVLLST